MLVDAQVGVTYLYYGINSWGSLMQRPQQIAKRLAEKNTVVFVDPIDDPLSYPLSWVRRVPVLGFPPLRFEMREISPTLYLVRFPGIVGGIRLLERLNDTLIDFYSSHMMTRLKENGINPDVLWLSHPRQSGALSVLSKGMVCCYDCMDDYDGMSKPSKAVYMATNERKIMSVADIIFATSSRLAEKCSIFPGKVVKMPNGVESSHFEPDPFLDGKNKEMRNPLKPVLGFFGNIGPWIDVELITTIARERSEWTIILVGPCNIPRIYRELAKYPNICLVGEVPYSELPRYSRTFDVCIMPFKTDSVGQSINPVKMYEYLATGLPVVSTNIREAVEMNKLIAIARNAEEFIDQVETVLGKHDTIQSARRIEEARRNTWHERVDTIERTVQDALLTK
jgi:glycosyltransferase involved in cell wall biosynthesis